jgi:hypothetical protein
MPDKLVAAAHTRLSQKEHEALGVRALSHGVRISEYLRSLVLADLQSVNDYNLQQTVEGEHTRLVILAAQKGQELTPQLLKSLRAEAIIRAPALVENTLRLLKQRSFADAV